MRLGAEAPFMRPPSLTQDYVDVTEVFRHTLEQLESMNYFPDLVVLLQTTFPFRPRGFIDRLIKQLVVNGLDSVMAVQPEYKACWTRENGSLQRIGKGFMPRQFKDPIYIGLSGLATVTHPAFLRQGDRFGANAGVLEIDDPACAFEVRDNMGLRLAEKILPDWWRENGVVLGEYHDREGGGHHTGPRGLQGAAPKKYPAPGWQAADCLLHRTGPGCKIC
jgi:CMP-N-acetylneuraminic acid synthetase